MPDGSEPSSGLCEGDRVGRYILLRDIEGRWSAVSAGAATALQQLDDGETLIMLPGGRLMQVPQPLMRVLAWFDGRAG